jgi:hypothetical protein
MLLLLHLDHTRNKIGCRTKHATFNCPSPSSRAIYMNKLNLLHLVTKTTKLNLHTKFKSMFGWERLGCMCVHHIYTSTKIINYYLVAKKKLIVKQQTPLLFTCDLDPTSSPPPPPSPRKYGHDLLFIYNCSL